MLAMARVLFILAVPAAVCAFAARFIDPTVLPIMPSTWLKVSGLLLLGSVSASVLQLAEAQAKKS